MSCYDKKETQENPRNQSRRGHSDGRRSIGHKREEDCKKMVMNFSNNNNHHLNNNVNGSSLTSEKRNSEISVGEGSSSLSTNSSTKNSTASSSSSSSSSSNATSKLSKIRRRLRESCRNFRGKNGFDKVSANVEDYTTVRAPNESTRSKHYVAMDFTGKVGKIVDRKDFRGISSSSSCSSTTAKDGYAYFRRKVEMPLIMTENQASIHENQPWFHPKLGRDQAQRILATHSIDGVFLVRDSSVAGGFVISYVHNGRTFHVQVLPDSLPDDSLTFYSLDEGKTRFFDILQMVEYYQLNRGILNTKLSHYIVSKRSGGSEDEDDEEDESSSSEIITREKTSSPKRTSVASSSSSASSTSSK